MPSKGRRDETHWVRQVGSASKPALQQRMSGLPPLMPGIMRIAADDSAILLGSRGHDGAPVFPPSADDDAAPVELGGTGTLHAFTTIHVRPPFGLPQPYSVGYVDLDEVPLRVFALLGGALRKGARMRLFARPTGVGGDGQPCLRPVFEGVPDG